MKAHELAKRLLEMPDENVFFTRAGGSGQPHSYDAILVDSVIFGKTENINEDDKVSLILLKTNIDIANIPVNKSIE